MDIDRIGVLEQILQCYLYGGRRFAVHHVRQWKLDGAGHWAGADVNVRRLGYAGRPGFDVQYDFGLVAFGG